MNRRHPMIQRVYSNEDGSFSTSHRVYSTMNPVYSAMSAYVLHDEPRLLGHNGVIPPE